MSVSQISLLPELVSAQPSGVSKFALPGQEQGGGFADRMKSALGELVDAQSQAISSAKAYEAGTETDLASVMVDQQISSLGFQMALNVRNKALGAYRDIMNMPV